jgi:hypothetical protein
VWIVVITFTALGAALIIWRGQFAYWQGMFFGARLHPGCALVEGVLFVLGALVFYMLFRLGIIPLRR